MAGFNPIGPGRFCAIADRCGRLLLPSREVIINLEWDAGTEGSLPLVSKMKLYAEQLPPGEHVLFVAPHAPREHAIRQAMRYVLGAETQDFPLFTTTVPMLAQEGQLGPAWRPIVDDEARARILELEGQPCSELNVERALAKPYWWDSRPGAGEGA